MFANSAGAIFDRAERLEGFNANVAHALCTPLPDVVTLAITLAFDVLGRS